jgi:hypothetical protein
MTLTEAVLSVVKEMEAEADGEDREEYSHTSAALHRYARELKNCLVLYTKPHPSDDAYIIPDPNGGTS